MNPTSYTIVFDNATSFVGFWCLILGGIGLAFMGACFLVYKYLPGILFCLFYYLVMVPVTIYSDLKKGVGLKTILKYDLTPRKGGRRS